MKYLICLFFLVSCVEMPTSYIDGGGWYDGEWIGLTNENEVFQLNINHSYSKTQGLILTGNGTFAYLGARYNVELHEPTITDGMLSCIMYMKHAAGSGDYVYDYTAWVHVIYRYEDQMIIYLSVGNAQERIAEMERGNWTFNIPKEG